MIRAQGCAVNGTLHDSITKRFRHEYIVDAPAHISFTNPFPLTPPRISPFLAWMLKSKRIGVAMVQPTVEFFTLLWTKPAGLPVVLRARKVDVSVGCVKIAHHNDILPIMTQGV